MKTCRFLVFIWTTSPPPSPEASKGLAILHSWGHSCRPHASCWHWPQGKTLLSTQSKDQQEETQIQRSSIQRDDSRITMRQYARVVLFKFFFFARVFPKIILNNYVPLLHFLSSYPKFFIIRLNNWKHTISRIL